LKRLYFDTVVFTPHQLAELVRLFGADHVIMGTDYPFDMAEYYPVEQLMSVEAISDAERRAVAGETATKLFGLD
jgi:aminocarboxymuconate-semialdehyde decarboxylase